MTVSFVGLRICDVRIRHVPAGSHVRTAEPVGDGQRNRYRQLLQRTCSVAHPVKLPRLILCSRARGTLHMPDGAHR